MLSKVVFIYVKQWTVLCWRQECINCSIFC